MVLCRTKIILFFMVSACSCSTGGCWQCVEISTICEQVLQHLVAMLVSRAGQVKRNRQLVLVDREREIQGIS